MNDNTFVVIMAGGVGSRFWPYSRTRHPKQFLDILGTGKTLIQHTFDRFRPLCPPENILIVSSENYKEQIINQIHDIKPDQILLEPLRKNTAPCIAYANQRIRRVNPDANIVVAPSDHLIDNESEFIQIIRQGLDFVRNRDVLLTLGIIPSRPETGYGYIQVNGTQDIEGIAGLRRVKTFTEKPNLELARVFLESGDFYWNSGIFIWSLRAIDHAMSRHLPDIQGLFNDGNSFYGTSEEPAFIRGVYDACDRISIDIGIMEKADNVFVQCADFGWSDLGTWGSLYEHVPLDESANAVGKSLVLPFGADRNMVRIPEGKLAVIQGLSDYIIVDTDDVLLICRKEDEQEIRKMVDEVKIRLGQKYI